MEGLTRGYAARLVKEGITVNAVAPSLIESGYTVIDVPMTTRHLSEPMKNIAALIDAGVPVSPNDPDAMLRHTAEARQRAIPFAADPSQQLARMDGEEIKPLIEGATYLFTNEYESALIEHKTGWSSAQVLERVEGDCGQAAVKTAMTAIWASRSGLSEKEILGVADLVPATWAPIRDALDEARLDGQLRRRRSNGRRGSRCEGRAR